MTTEFSAQIRRIWRDFLNPDDAGLTIGALSLKYKDRSKADIQRVLSVATSKRVLFGETDSEIWEHVFQSLKQLREEFSTLSGSLTQATSKDARDIADHVAILFGTYLSTYEADYLRFMSSPKYPKLSVPHKERNWPALGDAAADLIELRSLYGQLVRQLEAYSDGKQIESTELPQSNSASFWTRYAQSRTFCPTCNFNMLYASGGRCPICHPNKNATQIAKARANYGRA
jgi:hypothetical protein